MIGRSLIFGIFADISTRPPADGFHSGTPADLGQPVDERGVLGRRSRG